MRKAKWAKSTSGPDWVDIEATMRAVGRMHAGVVSLTILPAGIGATGGLRIVVSFVESLEPVESPDDIICLETEWPCREGCTFEGHCYAQLLALDFSLEMMGPERKKPK
jgi:hypothetical protein